MTDKPTAPPSTADLITASLAQAEHVRAEIDRQVRRHVVTWDETRWTCTCGDAGQTDRPT